MTNHNEQLREAESVLIKHVTNELCAAASALIKKEMSKLCEAAR